MRGTSRKRQRKGFTPYQSVCHTSLWSYPPSRNRALSLAALRPQALDSDLQRLPRLGVDRWHLRQSKHRQRPLYEGNIRCL